MQTKLNATQRLNTPWNKDKNHRSETALETTGGMGH